MSKPAGDPAAVADRVRAHVAWYSARAALPGGRRWSDVEVDWAWVAAERTAYALFPGPAPAVVWGRGLAVARQLRARSVAVWSAIDKDAPDLRAAGFEHGWQPVWMSRPTAGFVAGRAWIHLDGDLAGLFDLEVWPRFQRRGLGTELLG